MTPTLTRHLTPLLFLFLLVRICQASPIAAAAPSPITASQVRSTSPPLPTADVLTMSQGSPAYRPPSTAHTPGSSQAQMLDCPAQSVNITDSPMQRTVHVGEKVQIEWTSDSGTDAPFSVGFGTYPDGNHVIVANKLMATSYTYKIPDSINNVPLDLSLQYAFIVFVDTDEICVGERVGSQDMSGPMKILVGSK